MMQHDESMELLDDDEVYQVNVQANNCLNEDKDEVTAFQHHINRTDGARCLRVVNDQAASLLQTQPQ